MPYITVESGVLSDTQKEELIKRLTEISSEIMKIPQEFFVTTIKEVSDKNFGIGGKTIDKVKAEYMQTHNKQLQDNLKHMFGLFTKTNISKEIKMIDLHVRFVTQLTKRILAIMEKLYLFQMPFMENIDIQE